MFPILRRTGPLAARLALRIQDRFEQLSPSEQKLASLLVERTDDVLTHSATELAAMAGVSKTTAARLFKSLGYADFTEVRLQAREERNRTAPVHHTAVPIGRKRPASLAADHLQAELANLTRTFEELASDRLAEAARKLVQAPKLWVLGLGLEDGLARHARQLISRLRPEVHLLAGRAGGWAEDLAMLGPRDALLVTAFRPAQRPLRAILGWARTSRAEIVAVTDPTSRERFARLGALPICCHVMGADLAGNGLGVSHTTATSMLRLLALAMADRIGAAALRRQELIAAIHDELEDIE